MFFLVLEIDVYNQVNFIKEFLKLKLEYGGKKLSRIFKITHNFHSVIDWNHQIWFVLFSTDSLRYILKIKKLQYCNCT